MSHIPQRLYVADTVAVEIRANASEATSGNDKSQSSHIVAIREKGLATLMCYCSTRRSIIFSELFRATLYR